MLSVVTYEDMFMNFTHQFLQNFDEIASKDIQNGAYFDFEITGRLDKKRINPIIRKAKPEDIDEIIFTYKDIYENSYPYKEMEDREEIRKMLKSDNVEWLIFETVEGEIVGCFTFMLNFEKKLGNIRGFVIKKKFIGKVDIMKMALGSIVTMYKKYNDKIFRWYGECRTAHAKSQHFCSALGFKPVGFYPCKDIFYNKVESDLLIVSYDQRALTQMRSKEIPQILPEAINGFLYSNKRYSLGSRKIANTIDLNLNLQKIQKLQHNLIRQVSKDRFGYETIKLSYEGSDSFFEFLYTPTVINFEKTYYKVKNLEELYVFVQEFMECGKEYNIRYCEAFISAYEPTHQKIFANFGLIPRGYVPSWKYNQKKGIFEDCILFNWYEGPLASMQLLDEGQDLLEILGVQYSYEPRLIQKKKAISRASTGIKSRIMALIQPKLLNSSIAIGMTLYMILLFSSLGIATVNGYSITTHTISELSLSKISPFPFLFDISCILGGTNSILFYYLLTKKCKNSENYMVLSQYGMLTGFIGSVGIIFVGIFSLEHSHIILHGIFSVLAFGGFIFSITIFSIRICRCPLRISKLFIMTGLLPILSLVLYFTLLTPFYEWLMLISIIVSIIPLFGWTLFK